MNLIDPLGLLAWCLVVASCWHFAKRLKARIPQILSDFPPPIQFEWDEEKPKRKRHSPLDTLSLRLQEIEEEASCQRALAYEDYTQALRETADPMIVVPQNDVWDDNEAIWLVPRPIHSLKEE
jgi:hypothetical protein